MLDAQVDNFQREVTGLAADPADLPPGLFLPAGEAWLRCQAGLEDGDTHTDAVAALTVSG